MRRLTMIGLFLLVSACTTTPRQGVETWDAVPADQTNPLLVLQKSLGMMRAPENLGAEERSHNSCGASSEGEPCRTRYLTVINFQLLCRDSEGTVSDTPVHLEPIQTDSIEWNIGAIKGQSRTNDRGYGQAVALSDQSVMESRFTVRMGAQFLGLSVADVSKVVLPSNFCRTR